MVPMPRWVRIKKCQLPLWKRMVHAKMMSMCLKVKLFAKFCFRRTPPKKKVILAKWICGHWLWKEMSYFIAMPFLGVLARGKNCCRLDYPEKMSLHATDSHFLAHVWATRERVQPKKVSCQKMTDSIWHDLPACQYSGQTISISFDRHMWVGVFRIARIIREICISRRT